MHEAGRERKQALHLLFSFYYTITFKPPRGHLLLRDAPVGGRPLIPVAADEDPPVEVEEEGEGGGEGGMEVIGIPRDPIMPVENVRVRVVPRPMHEAHRHDVIRQVDQYLRQSHCDHERDCEFFNEEEKAFIKCHCSAEEEG